MLIRLKEGKVIKVEKIGLDHASIIVKFGNKMRFEAPYVGKGLIGKPYTLKKEKRLIKANRARHTSSYVAIYNSDAIGLAGVDLVGGELSRHVAYCGYMVAKEFRGTGLSYFLVHMAAAHAAKSVKTVLAAIIPQNKASVAFFKRCGGTKVGEFKKTIYSRRRGRYYNNTHMQVTLSKLINGSKRMWKSKGVIIVR